MAAVERSKTPAPSLRAQYLCWMVSPTPRPPPPPSGGAAAVMKAAAVDLVAGTAGAVVSVYAGQPMDTVKVKMQTFPEQHRTMLRCIVNTYTKDGGIRGLYAGTVPSLAANIAENSVLFAAYGLCQKTVAVMAAAKGPEQLSSLGNATAGFLAAFFSSLTLCPTELVKCRLQAMREVKETSNVTMQQKSVGPWSVTRHILRTDGVPGLFRGLTATFAREMPGYFFFFGGYELTRSLLVRDAGSKDDIGHLNTFLSGGVAGLCLWVAIFPADVIKSRIQVTGSRTPMWRMAVDIYRKEGAMAFYNGLGPTVIRTFPCTGLLLVTYEAVKASFREDV